MISNADRRLAELLGITDDEMERFVIEAHRMAAAEPRPAIVAVLDPLTVSLIVTAVSTALSVGASLIFKPRAPGKPGEVRISEDSGTNSRVADRVAPRDGFQGLAASASLGDPIPTVYALRETLGALSGRPAGVYGGVRVNMPMVWSELRSRGTHQLFRGVFMLGEGSIASVDPLGFALAGRAISPYNLGDTGSNETGSRVTVYLAPNGGRFTNPAAQRVAGRLAANDPGNAVNEGAADAFQVRSLGGAFRPDSCITGAPSNSTTFGVYGLMPNGLAFRVNPLLRPTKTWQTEPRNTSSTDLRAIPEDDQQALVDVWKMIYHWTHRCGITATSPSVVDGNANLGVGDTFVYTIDEKSDGGTRLRFNSSNTDQTVELSEPMVDIATTVASRQSRAFDGLALGEIYKAGSCLAVLESLNTDQPFVSEADNEPIGGGQQIEATFRVVRAGRVWVTTAAEMDPAITGTGVFPDRPSEANDWDWTTRDRGPQYATATARGQLHRCAIADFTIEGAVEVFEIGIRSAVGISDRGFVDTRRLKTLREINRLAGGERYGEIIGEGETIDISVYQPSTAPRPERRASFWRVFYRLEGTANFVPLSLCFGVTGANQQNAFNAIRVQLPATNNLQVRIEPLTGWEIAQNVATGDLAVLDGSRPLRGPITSGAATIWYRGEAPRASRPSSLFQIPRLEPGQATSITSLAQTTEGRGYIPGTYNGVQIVQGGNTTARARVVIGAEGGADTGDLNVGDITITNPGEGYATGAFTLGGFDGDDDQSLEVTANATTDVFTLASGTLNVGDRAKVVFSTTGTLPAPLVVGTEYSARDLTSTSFKVAAAGTTTPGINITTAGTGVHTATINVQIPFAGTISAIGREDLGILWTEGQTLVGEFARLAEVFPYPELETSSMDGPEHEVVYVNSVTTPASAVGYDGIAVVGMSILSGPELTAVDQPSAYVTGAKQVRRLLSGDTTGPSHLWPDVLLDKLLNSKDGAGARITESMIDIDSFRTAAQWCLDRRYFFDGVIEGQINVPSWATELAPAFLLRFGESGGRYYLKPAITFDPVVIKALFTAGNIEEGTFSLNYLEPEDRQRIRVSVRFREERASSNLASPGLFAVTREILVAEVGGTGNEPIEVLDMTAYCTNRWHAIDAAKLLIRSRRYSTHIIKSETTYDYENAALAPDEYYRAAMEETFYNGYTNGIVTPSGTLVSKVPMTDGVYSVIAWNRSSAAPPAPATLTVFDGGTTATPVNRVFTVVDPLQQVRCYRAVEIKPLSDGRFEISGQESPVNGDGRLLASLDWDNGAVWEIVG